MRAVLQEVTIAESDDTVVVEGNHYFPKEAVNTQYLIPSGTHTTCPWKGKASYYHVEVDGERIEDGAWYYAEPEPAAQQIAGRVAFWKGVEVKP